MTHSGREISCDSPPFSVFNVDMELTQRENRLRTLLSQCSCCNMYQLPINYHECLKTQYLKGFPLNSPIVCEKCCLISEQERIIHFLNDQIHELSATVERLRSIRSIENEIDMSLIDTFNTGDHFQNQSLSDLTSINVANSNTVLPSNNNITKSDNANDTIESLSNQFSMCKISENKPCLAENSTLGSIEPSLPSESSVTTEGAIT